MGEATKNVACVGRGTAGGVSAAQWLMQPRRPAGAPASLTAPESKKPSLEAGLFASIWWPRAESNHRHADFQSAALPTELLGREPASIAGFSGLTVRGRRCACCGSGRPRAA